MPSAAPPNPTWLYRLVHVDNLHVADSGRVARAAFNAERRLALPSHPQRKRAGKPPRQADSLRPGRDDS